MNQQIDKPDFNEEYRICDFSTVLESTDTVTSATAVIIDEIGTDLSSTMLEEVAVAPGNKGVRYKLKGGVSSKKYELSLRVATQSNQKFEEVFTVCII